MVEFSEAAFTVAAATITQPSDVIIDDVNMHPDHNGLLRYAILMGARIHILDQRWEKGIPVSKLRIQHAKQLTAVTVRPEHLATLINDLPAFVSIALCAKGMSQVRGLPADVSMERLNALYEALHQEGVQAVYEDGVFSIPGLEHQGQKPAKSILARFKEYSS